MANPFAAIVGQRRAQSLLSRGSKMAVPLGPWPRGMLDSPEIIDTSKDHLSALPDGAASLLVNFDVLSDGTLQARRGFHGYTFVSTSTHDYVTNAIGTVYFNEIQYILFSARDTTANTTNIYWFWVDSAGVFHTQLAKAAPFAGANLDFAGIHYYNNVLWLISKNAVLSSQSSNAGNTPGAADVWNASVNVPVGDISLIVKERLFIANAASSRVYYSKATDFSIWAAPDGGFFDVSPNQGNIVSMILDQSNLYIFKDTGVWLFSFSTDPAVDGYLRKISDIPVWDALFYNGTIYAVGPFGFYSVIGAAFNKLNKNIKAIPNKTNNFTSHVVRINNLIGFACYLGNGNVIRWAMFNINTGTWTYYDFNASVLIVAQNQFAYSPVNPYSLGKHGVETFSGQYRYVIFPAEKLGDGTQGFGASGFYVVNYNNDSDAPGYLQPVDGPIDPLGVTGVLNVNGTNPFYFLQTKAYEPAPGKLFKFLYGSLDWYMASNLALGFANSIHLKFLRSIKRTEYGALSLITNAISGVLAGIGPTYTGFKTSSNGVSPSYNVGVLQFNEDPNVVVISNFNSSQRLKTRTIVAQLFFDFGSIGQSYGGAPTLRLNIYNIYIHVTFPTADVSLPISAG